MEEARKEYAYVLCIGNEISKLLATWWGTFCEMQINKGAMCIGARAFRKTASILVYERTDAPRGWKYCEAFNVPGNLLIPETIYIKDGVIFYD